MMAQAGTYAMGRMGNPPEGYPADLFRHTKRNIKDITADDISDYSLANPDGGGWVYSIVLKDGTGMCVRADGLTVRDRERLGL